jgi:cullin-associated NEDD8-dissociated protein 1
LIPRLLGRIVTNKPKVKLPAVPAGMLDIDSNKELDPEAVDVLIEVVRCFGPMLQQSEVEALQGQLITILETERASSVVKKRAVVAVSILAIYLWYNVVFTLQFSAQWRGQFRSDLDRI